MSVSCLIWKCVYTVFAVIAVLKVHGLKDKVAITWTRKLKEYLELMAPSNKYPYHFSRRDERGDIQVVVDVVVAVAVVVS